MITSILEKLSLGIPDYYQVKKKEKHPFFNRIFDSLILTINKFKGKEKIGDVKDAINKYYKNGYPITQFLIKVLCSQHGTS